MFRPNEPQSFPPAASGAADGALPAASQAGSRLTSASARLIAFGFVCAFSSSFGQTFFIALFGGEIRASFGLTHGGFGAVYSAATLLSGLTIIRAGGLIDRVRLRRYAAGTILGLAVAAACMSQARHPLLLLAALFLLRLFGQGLMSHVAVTTMARSFTTARGRAIAVASLGHPAGEVVFPAAGILLLAAFGWRDVWAVAAGTCLVVVLPLAMLLLGNVAGDPPPAGRAPVRAWRLLTERRMLLALPAFSAMSFVATAVAFHQVLLAASKGWPAALFASAFAVNATTFMVSMLVFGFLVDRFTARRLAAFFLVPIAVGCLVLAVRDEPWSLFVYMVLAGTSGGAQVSITNGLLAEVYGVERLGGVRAAMAAVMVVSSALSPVAFGVLVDLGLPVDALLAGLGILVLGAVALLLSSGMLRAESRPTGGPAAGDRPPA